MARPHTSWGTGGESTGISICVSGYSSGGPWNHPAMDRRVCEAARTSATRWKEMGETSKKTKVFHFGRSDWTTLSGC